MSNVLKSKIVLEYDNGWCPDFVICIDWIERRVNQRLENFQDVDSVYMSEDIYDQFLDSMHGSNLCNKKTPSFHDSSVIVSVAGNLTITRVPGISNFCHVGTRMSCDQLIRIRVDQMFEDIVLKDCERE